VMATLAPKRELINVDFPALERPRSATKPLFIESRITNLAYQKFCKIKSPIRGFERTLFFGDEISRFCFGREKTDSDAANDIISRLSKSDSSFKIGQAIVIVINDLELFISDNKSVVVRPAVPDGPVANRKKRVFIHNGFDRRLVAQCHPSFTISKMLSAFKFPSERLDLSF